MLDPAPDVPPSAGIDAAGNATVAWTDRAGLRVARGAAGSFAAATTVSDCCRRTSTWGSRRAATR